MCVASWVWEGRREGCCMSGVLGILAFLFLFSMGWRIQVALEHGWVLSGIALGRFRCLGLGCLWARPWRIFGQMVRILGIIFGRRISQQVPNSLLPAVPGPGLDESPEHQSPTNPLAALIHSTPPTKPAGNQISTPPSNISLTTQPPTSPAPTTQSPGQPKPLLIPQIHLPLSQPIPRQHRRPRRPEPGCSHHRRRCCCRVGTRA